MNKMRRLFSLLLLITLLLADEDTENIEKERLKVFNAFMAFGRLNSLATVFMYPVPDKTTVRNRTEFESAAESLASLEIYLVAFKFEGSVFKSGSELKSKGSCEFLMLKLKANSFLTEVKKTDTYKNMSDGISSRASTDKEDILLALVSISIKEMFISLNNENKLEDSGTSYSLAKKKLEELIESKKVLKTTESKVKFSDLPNGKRLVVNYSSGDSPDKVNVNIYLETKEESKPFKVNPERNDVTLRLGGKDFVLTKSTITNEVFVFNLKKMFFFNQNWNGVLLAVVVPLSVLGLTFGFSYFGI